jgi:hypothetical protein
MRLRLLVGVNRSILPETVQIKKASWLGIQDAFLLTWRKSTIYWTDALIIWYHRSMALDGERYRWSKWFGFAFGSGLAVLKNEQMLFTF